ncbi:MAG: HEAT repeat domain-containing protein [Planctomycetes bacterium]|nr:HEAT repeat domain-containing protein [Planctomycetota bacterium]
MMTARTFGTALLLAGAMCAQDPGEQRLQRAITVEEAEHDVAAAAERFRELVADASLPAALRTRAALRLALAMRELGDAQAFSAALTAAAAGEGPAAAEARALLQDPERGGPGDREVELRILQLVAELKNGPRPDLFGELVFFGARSLPVVTRAIDGENGDIRYVKTLASVVWRVGGAEAVAWLGTVRATFDALKRRAVVAGIQVDMRTEIARDLAPCLVAFLGDADPLVRLEIVQGGPGRVLTAAQLAPSLADADPRVRAAAFEVLAGQASPWRNTELRDERMSATAAIVDALCGDGGTRIEPAIRQRIVTRLVGDPEVYGEVAGLGLLLRLATSGDRLDASRWPSLDRPGTDALAAELSAAARILAEVGDPAGNREFVQAVLDRVLPGWTSAAGPAARDLTLLGYAIPGDWLALHLDAASWRAVLARPGAVRPAALASAARALRTEPLQAASVAALRGWFDRGVAGAAAARDPELTLALDQVGYLLASQSGDDALGWALPRIRAGCHDTSLGVDDRRRATRLRWMLFAGLTRRADPARLAAVRTLVLDPMFDDLAMRNAGLGWLARRGAPEPAELFRAALALPLAGPTAPADEGVVQEEMPELRETAAGYGLPTGAAWLFVEGSIGWDRATVRGVVRALLQEGNPRVWLAAGEVFAPLRAELEWLRDAMVLSWRACASRSALDGALRSCELALEGKPRSDGPVLSRPDATVIGAWLDALAGDSRRDRNPSRFWNAVQGLPELRGAELVVSRVRPFLTSDDPYDRRNALRHLVAVRSADAGELIARFASDPSEVVRQQVFASRLEAPGADRRAIFVEMLRDPDASIRRNGAVRIRSNLDRDYVEPLLELLRDPDDGVRSDARETLEAIRYYLEERERFGRLLREDGFGTDSAAEALLQQARAGGEPRIRLAAIRSLGTLGVPETLPFLIRLMQDVDPDIAAAAATAVDRINARGNGAPAEGR